MTLHGLCIPATLLHQLLQLLCTGGPGWLPAVIGNESHLENAAMPPITPFLNLHTMAWKANSSALARM